MAIRNPIVITRHEDGIDYDDTPLMFGGDRAADADPAPYSNRMQMYTKRAGDGFLDMWIQDDRGNKTQLTFHGEPTDIPATAVPFGDTDEELTSDVTSFSWNPTTKTLQLAGAAAANPTLSSKVIADAQVRFSIAADGTLSFGPGNAAADVTLARTAAGVVQLKTLGTQQKLRVYSSGGEYIELSADNASSVATVRAHAGGFLGLGIGAATFWSFWTDGHWLAEVDNTYDIGSNGSSRARSIYWGTQLRGPAGTATAPSFSFAGEATTGLYFVSTGRVGCSAQNSFDATLNDGKLYARLTFGNTGTIGGNLAFADALGGGNDAIIGRIASDVIGQVRGTTAQAFRVYGTTTGPKYVTLFHDGTNGHVDTAASSGQLKVGLNATFIAFGATFIANSDNTYDIGASGASRPRSFYFGTQIFAPDGSSTNPSYAFASSPNTGFAYESGAIKVYHAGVLRHQFNAGGGAFYTDTSINIGDMVILQRNGTGVCEQVNGTTAQTFRVYGTTTGSKYLSMAHDGTDATISTPSGAGNIFMIPTGGTVVQIHCGTSASHLYVHNTYTSAANREVGLVSWISNEFIFGTSTLGGGPARGIRINTENAAAIRFSTTATGRWEMSSSGHFLAFTDNVYDIGASGATRPRSIYFGTQALGVSSTVTPAFSFAGSTTYGMGMDVPNSALAWITNGSYQMALSSVGSLFVSGTLNVYGNQIQFGGTFLGAGDVVLVRDTANVLAQKNSTTAQKFRVYGTTTGPKYAELRHDGTDTYLESQSGNLYLYQNGAIAWGATSSAWVPAATDNVMDLASSGNRARSGYFGTALIIGTSPATAGALRLAYGDTVVWRNNANNGNMGTLQVTTVNSVADICKVGDDTVGVILRARSGGAAPSTSDLPAGTWTVWRDTGGGTTKIYYNNAGAIIASAAFS